MSRYYWLIDAGHGGIKDGVYTTAPAKMHTFEDGYVIYEGDVNRKIAKKFYTLLNQHGIEFGLVYHETEDTKLDQRIAIVNKVYEKDPRCVLLSIHSNAGGGKGFEVFTSIGENRSDKFGEVIFVKYKTLLPQFVFRSDPSDGDHDKEARFAMVGYEKNGKWYGPRCPAILVENLFFDNRAEAEYLNSDEGQDAIANVLLQSVLACEKNIF